MSPIFNLKKTVPLASGERNGPVQAYLFNLARGSRPTMKSTLGILAGLLTGGKASADTMPWHELRYEHTSMLRAELQERYSAATVNKMLSALSRVLKEARRLHLMDSDDYMEAIDFERVKGATLLAGREIKKDEIASLLEACAGDPLPARAARDAAIIAVFRVTGIRRAELCGLTLADFDQDAQTLTIRGKRNKQRTVYIAKVKPQLLAWLQARGDKPGPLFFRISKGGKVQLSLTHGLNAASINYILEQREKQAGLKKRATPHDFRRTMISSFLDAGVDIATVQKIAGHENTSTTSKYDRRGEDAKRKAAEKVDLPDINGWTVPTPPTQKRTQKPTKNTRA